MVFIRKKAQIRDKYWGKIGNRQIQQSPNRKQNDNRHSDIILFRMLRGFYSIKAWPYRIICIIINNKEIWIVHIKHRGQVYMPLRLDI
ncbi:MAG: type II toxin-antitoxin system RelE/ParE family toxin [Candidatus Nealsonbacteria bacterium]|nr:type II toxin-antitoxin system RelE/ParE family toxin [Candidatus Nealsonbacteria bacterium]